MITVGAALAADAAAEAMPAAQPAMPPVPPQAPPAAAPGTRATAAIPEPAATAPVTRLDRPAPYAVPTVSAPYTPPPAPPSPAPAAPYAPPAAAWPGARPRPVRGNRTGVIASVVAAALVVGVAGAVYLSRTAGDSTKGDGTSASAQGSGAHSGPVSHPGSAPGSGAPSTRPDPKPVAFKGINIPKGYWVRFADSPPKPVQEEEGANARFGDSADFYYDNDAFVSDDQTPVVGSNSEKVVLLNNAEKGSLATCRNETRYAEDIHLSQLSAGSQICVHTKAGHIAVVTYKGAAPRNGPSDYISVDITVWRNAEQPSADQ
ncbi:hypothetical protein AB0C13_20945 [Streptomyces sp. NPDC049099]|uniref:hypothetical protein n=1 Tax=Streptomyces sp. NPDC049099 TaxID=3155768 RepID=UPI0034423767